MQTWERVRRIVALAIESDPPETVEECEELVASLDLVRQDPEAVNRLLAAVQPELALRMLHKMNPSFSLEDPPREVVQSVVETLQALRPAKTPPPQ